MNEKVIVTSMVSGNVGLTLPHLRFVKTWPKKGTKLPIDKEILREAIYDPGVEYMFKNGILYIEDMDFKVELGLEEEGAKAPTAIVPLDEKYLERVLKRMPVAEMRKVIKEMNLKVYPVGTVICSCSATLGAYAINTQPLITNQTFIGIVCGPKIINKYL